MKFQTRFLILLLIIGLGPLIAFSLISTTTTRWFVQSLSGDMGRRAVADSAEALHKTAEARASLLANQYHTLELMVQVQTLALQAMWDGRLPVDQVGARAPDAGVGSKPATTQSVKPAGRCQVHLPPGVARSQVREDIGKLEALMRRVMLADSRPLENGVVLWRYVQLNNGVLIGTPASGPLPVDYDGRSRSWYQQAVATGRMVRSVAYHDASSGEPVMTISAPVYANDRRLIGVTAVDVSVARLLQVNQAGLGEVSVHRALVVIDSAQGLVDPGHVRVIAEANADGQARIFPDRLMHMAWSDSGAVIRDVQAGRSGVQRLIFNKRQMLGAYAPLSPDADAFLLLVMPYQQVEDQASHVRRYIMMRLSDELFYTEIIGGVVLLLVILLGWWMSHRATRRVAGVISASRQVASGDLGAQVPVTGHDEISELAENFNAMVPKLRDYLAMSQALAIADEVQRGLLPAEPPSRPGLDIAGSSVYCEQTGGDYYDYVRIDDGRLVVAVGDVSGHGMPAALLMAAGQAALRSQLAEGDLARALSAANRALMADQFSGRFMTLHLLALDRAAGELSWICAGHDPATVYDPQTGNFYELAITGNVPLGIVQTQCYEPKTMVWPEPGTVMVIGTDGIWETFNAERQMFGKQRMQAVIAAHASESSEQIMQAIYSAIAEFRGDLPQEDDVTMLVIKFVDS